MRIIAVISPKGGTGKSSLSQALAVAAARDGPSVLFDLDPQGTSARWFSVQRAAHPRAPRLPLSLRTARPNELASRALEDASSASWLICDTAGGAFHTIAEALEVADLAVVPLQPYAPDLATAPDMAAAAAGLSKPPPLLAALNRVGSRSAERVRMARAALAVCGIPVASALISQGVVWPDAYEAGLAAQEMPLWRSHRAQREISGLWREILRLVPPEQPAAPGETA